MFDRLIFNSLYFEIVFLALVFILINLILKKNSFLLDNVESSNHKKKVFSNLGTPLSGGLLFIIFFSIYFFKYNFNLVIFLILMYLIGLMSDLNFIKSPRIRIFSQAFLVVIYIVFTKTQITTLSVPLFDDLLKNYFVNIFFVTFCILILVNGYNFIDGINTLVIGNFILFLGSILLLSNQNDLFVEFNFLYLILIIFLIIFCFNLIGKSFLGDSGSYCIGFLISVIAISFAYNNFNKVSPYYIAALLWYPAFENLFSIIRRILNKKKLSNPDSKHLHQLIYLHLSEKLGIKNKLYLNSLTGIIINLFLTISIFITFFVYAHTISLVILILANVSIYLLLYYYLYKKY